MNDSFIHLMDFAGTAIFALTGAIKGINKSLDLLGVVVLGCTVGIGGGVIRDAVLGMTPASALSNPGYLLVCIITSIIIFLLPRRWFDGNRTVILIADAVGLGVFTALGNAKAAQLNLPHITIVLSGVFTAVGGGMIRDVLVCSIPHVLQYDFYATASLLGGVLYTILDHTAIPSHSLFGIVALFVFLLRMAAYHLHLHLPKYRESRQIEKESRRMAKQQ